MQHICLYCTGANASNTAANQTDLSLWDSANADQGPVVTTGPTHSSSISHCNSAGCNEHKKPSAPPASSVEEEAEEDEDDDDFIDEDNPLLLDQVGICFRLCFANGRILGGVRSLPPRGSQHAVFGQSRVHFGKPMAFSLYNLATFSISPIQITEDEFKEFESGMAVSRYDGRGNHVRVNCCSALMKECLEVIDAEASHVLQCEDLEDLDLSALNLVVCRETLNVKGEMEVFNALVRWSGRECKRQRLEMTNANRRKVLEGCQYLVRYVKTKGLYLLSSRALKNSET